MVYYYYIEIKKERVFPLAERELTISEKNAKVKEKLNQIMSVNRDSSGSFITWKPEYLEDLETVLNQDVTYID